MRRVVSVLHHPLPHVNGKIAEEQGHGWHFRSARALTKYDSFLAIAARPNTLTKWNFKSIDNVVIALAPALDISPSEKMWKWSYVSPSLASFVEYLVRHGYIPYIHEYRALNSEIVLRGIIDYNVILQHHGSSPPHQNSFGDPLKMLKEFSKLRRDLYLKKVRGIFFVLNRREKLYLREVLNVDANVKIRTMAVDFRELKPLSEEEKIGVRKTLRIKSDDILLTTYVGVFGEEFSGVKGAHLILKIWRELKEHFRNRVKMVVTGVGGSHLSLFREAGILAHRFLPHKDYIKVVGASDAYFLPATSGYLYGGSGAVAIMEAMAMGIPVVSPTLRDFPEPSRVKEIGVMTKYVDDDNALKEFVDALIYVVENRKHYKSWVIRELSKKYYSWESFVNDFNDVVRKF